MFSSSCFKLSWVSSHWNRNSSTLSLPSLHIHDIHTAELYSFRTRANLPSLHQHVFLYFYTVTWINFAPSCLIDASHLVQKNLIIPQLESQFFIHILPCFPVLLVFSPSTSDLSGCSEDSSDAAAGGEGLLQLPVLRDQADCLWGLRLPQWATFPVPGRHRLHLPDQWQRMRLGLTPTKRE